MTRYGCHRHSHDHQRNDDNWNRHDMIWEERMIYTNTDLSLEGVIKKELGYGSLLDDGFCPITMRAAATLPFPCANPVFWLLCC
mmetsp:Transcript_21001/g.45554  ORF Transcript_21001/g.45554 Transcript_21001/m.45554 type:complete len:84 (+) Transcript_21001:1271-1522(+)